MFGKKVDVKKQVVPVEDKEVKSIEVEELFEVGTIATSTEQAVIYKPTGETVDVTTALVEILNTLNRLEKLIKG